MRAFVLIAPLLIALALVSGLSWAETPTAPRLEGQLPANAPVISIDQPRGTVLDALDAISKQTGWSLVVAAPESVSSRPLTIRISKRPVNEALTLVLEAGALRATFADGVLKVRPEAAAESETLVTPKPGRSGRREKGK